MRFTKWFRNPFWLALALALILTVPVWLPGHALYWGTPYFQFIPWRWLALQQLLQGRLPWWNPFTGLGTPLLANYQTGVFYPGTWLTWLAGLIGGLPGLAYAHGWWVVGHLLLGAWGMAVWLEEMGYARPAAWLGGLAYGFSGYAVARGGIFLSMNAAMAWTPWVLWGVHRVFIRPSRRHVGLLALMLTLQWLAGHAQTAWYTLLLAGLWGLSQSRRPSAWAGLLAAFGVALLCSAGQLAATAQYTLLSARSHGLNPDFALQYSFWPWYYLLLLSPWMFGHPALGNHWGYPALWEHSVYVGVLPLFLALYAVFRHPRRMAFWIGVLLAAQVLALGRFTPVYPWLFQHIPTFATFQAPARWHLWSMVALAVLAAHAAAEIKPFTRLGRYWLNLGMAGTAGMALLALLAAFQLAGKYATPAWGLLSFSLTAFLTLLTMRLTLPRGRESWLQAALLVTALDLAFNQQGWYPATRLSAYAASFPGREALAQRLGHGRFWMPQPLQERLQYRVHLNFSDFHPHRPLWTARAALLPNTNLMDGFPGVNAYDPLLPKRFAWLMQALQTWPERPRIRLLRLLGVTLEVVEGEGGKIRYRPRRGLPWLGWYPQARQAPDMVSAFATLAHRLQGPAWNRWIVIETPDPTVSPTTPLRDSRRWVLLRGRMFLDGAWEITVHTPAPGYLVLRQAWYPGWQAWIDGQPARLYPAEGVLMALPVPQGNHQIVVRYRPIPLYAAVAVQTVAWVGWGLLMWGRLSLPARVCRGRHALMEWLSRISGQRAYIYVHPAGHLWTDMASALPATLSSSGRMAFAFSKPFTAYLTACLFSPSSRCGPGGRVICGAFPGSLCLCWAFGF